MGKEKGFEINQKTLKRPECRKGAREMEWPDRSCGVAIWRPAQCSGGGVRKDTQRRAIRGKAKRQPPGRTKKRACTLPTEKKSKKQRGKTHLLKLVTGGARKGVPNRRQEGTRGGPTTPAP